MKEYRLTTYDSIANKTVAHRIIILNPTAWMDGKQDFLTSVYKFDNFVRVDTGLGGWELRCTREAKGRLKKKDIYFYLYPIN